MRNWARKKGSGESDSLPLVLVGKSENALRIFFVDEKAGELGIHPGLSLSDARARVSELEVIEADEAADRMLLASIADWCDRFTPLVAFDPPHGLFLDISGCAHLFGGERATGERIVSELRSKGFTTHYAIAGTAAATRAIARSASGSIVETGGEANAIAPLPVVILQVERDIVAALKRAGLKTIGEVALRKRSELVARFGSSFVFYLDQILGKTDTPISPLRHIPDFIVERSYAEPLATTDVIEHALSSLVKSLCEILESQGKGARAMEASFYQTDGAVRRIAVETSTAIRDNKTIERLFRERLEGLVGPLDPGFGFDFIRMSALRVENFNHEEINFDSSSENMREISTLIDRLSARFGANRVLKFEALDSHCPERAARLVVAQRATQIALWHKFAEPPRWPLRLFEPPEPLQSVLAEAPDGPPVAFVWRRAKHKIVHAEGPERIASEWWRFAAALPTRDYFRVEDDEGQRYWIYREGLYMRETRQPAWFVHGTFA